MYFYLLINIHKSILCREIKETYLISAILVPPFPIIQPISSFGTVISWVCVPGPVPAGVLSCDPASAASAETESTLIYINYFYTIPNSDILVKIRCVVKKLLIFKK